MTLLVPPSALTPSPSHSGSLSPFCRPLTPAPDSWLWAVPGPLSPSGKGSWEPPHLCLPSRGCMRKPPVPSMWLCPEERSSQAAALRGRVGWDGGPHKPSDSHGATMQPPWAAVASVAVAGPTGGSTPRGAILRHPAGRKEPASLLFHQQGPQG